MNVRYFRPVLMILAVGIVGTLHFLEGTLGLSSEYSSSDGYMFAGGTTPWAIAVAAVVLLIYFLLMISRPGEDGPRMPSLARRFLAFWLDFLVAMAATAPLIGIIPMFAEWKRTDFFHGSFSAPLPNRAIHGLP
jgi:hypothetical protein